MRGCCGARALLVATGLALLLAPWPSAASPPDGHSGWRAFPNPFTNRFRISLPDSTTPLLNPEMRIRVFDMRGRLVWHRDFARLDPHAGVVIDWDGSTDGGASASSGWYIFDIRLKDWPPTDHIRFKMLRIRGTLSSSYNWEWS